MNTRIPFLVALLAVVMLTWLTVGCDAPGRRVGPAVAAQTPSADASPTEANADAADDESDAEEQAEEKLRQAEDDAKDARKLAKLERELAAAGERLARTQLGHAHAKAEQGVALAQAMRELELERQRFDIFVNRSSPNRIENARLSLARAQDRATEAEEELKQLEMMYAEDDFADQTKEIVLERGRRRLERSKRDLELRNEDFAILTELTIPLETAEHKLKVEQKTRSLDKARRSAEASQLDQKIELFKAEGTIIQAQGEIEDHGIDAARKQRERDKKDKEEKEKQQDKAEAKE